MQQLDIFGDGREVQLRNDAVLALQRRDPAAGRRALEALSAEVPDDPIQAPLAVLIATLATRMPTGEVLDQAGIASARQQLIQVVEPAARQVFGIADGAEWVRPLWADLAQAARRQVFSAATADDHAAPLWLRAGEAAAARDATATIASWRRIPAPLAWMAEAVHRGDGLDAAWPLLTELAWLDASRWAALFDRLADPLLNSLRRRFDAEFDDEACGEEGDARMSWFPAWLLTDKPALAVHLELAQPGLQSPAEQGARLVLELLRLEKAGRQHELIARRGALKALHEGLFAAYMKTR